MNTLIRLAIIVLGMMFVPAFWANPAAAQTRASLAQRLSVLEDQLQELETVQAAQLDLYQQLVTNTRVELDKLAAENKALKQQLLPRHSLPPKVKQLTRMPNDRAASDGRRDEFAAEGRLRRAAMESRGIAYQDSPRHQNGYTWPRSNLAVR